MTIITRFFCFELITGTQGAASRRTHSKIACAKAPRARGDFGSFILRKSSPPELISLINYFRRTLAINYSAHPLHTRMLIIAGAELIYLRAAPRLIWMVIAFLIELLARNLHHFSLPAPRALLLLRYKLSLCAPQWEKCAWQNKKLIACTLAIIAAPGRKCKSVFGIWLGSLSGSVLAVSYISCLSSAVPPPPPMLLLPLTTYT